MDVFNLNWTQLMKNDMVVNKVLNNDEVKKPDVKRPGHMIRFKRRAPAEQMATDKRIREKNGVYYRPKKAPYTKARLAHLKHDKNVFDIHRDVFWDPHPDNKIGRYYDNAAPQSLYNLHYSSIRN